MSAITAIKLLTKIMKQVSSDKRSEILDFAEYVQHKEVEKAGTTAQIIESLEQVKKRKFRPARQLLNEI